MAMSTPRAQRRSTRLRTAMGSASRSATTVPFQLKQRTANSRSSALLMLSRGGMSVQSCPIRRLHARRRDTLVGPAAAGPTSVSRRRAGSRRMGQDCTDMPPRDDMSKALDREFAVLCFDWDGTAVADRQADATAVRSRVERLCALGVDIAIVSGTNVTNVDG